MMGDAPSASVALADWVVTTVFVIYQHRVPGRCPCTRAGKRDAHLLHQGTVPPHGGDERRDLFLDFFRRVDGARKRENGGRDRCEGADDGCESGGGGLWLRRRYDVADDG